MKIEKSTHLKKKNDKIVKENANLEKENEILLKEISSIMQQINFHKERIEHINFKINKEHLKKEKLIEFYQKNFGAKNSFSTSSFIEKEK